MSKADSEDDRTVIRPPMNPAPADDPASAPTTPEPGDSDRTRIAGAPAPAPDSPDMGGHLPVGTRLAEFEIISLIGEGGFGIVYLAHDHSLQRRVALKEYMPTSLAARSGGSQVQVKSARYRETFDVGLKSFVNEARLLASFDHPSLVRVYRFWEANGTAYMVMPFLEGTTLKDVLRDMGRPPDEAWLLATLDPLTEALLVIHAAQCYHRDIAPDNVMLLPATHSWLLLDFGAARRVIGDMTQALTVILKPGYAPVEQYAEVPGMKQGPWTDVYALAAVVYFAITGHTPPSSVARLLNDTYVPAVQAAAGRYSEPFLAAMDRALAVRPEERTQTIDEFRRELGLGDSIVPMPPAGDRPAAPTAMMAPPHDQPGLVTQLLSASPASAPSTARPTAPPAPTPKSRLGIGIGVGAAVLAVVAVGAYVALGSGEPASKPSATAALPSTTAPIPAAAAPTPVSAATPPPAAAALPTNPVSEAFVRAVQSQSPGFDVLLRPDRNSYRIGKDNLNFTVQALRTGYLYVFAYAADRVLVQLYPKPGGRAVKVNAGQTVTLPQSPDVIRATDPPGTTELLAVVSPNLRDHASLQPRGDIGFFVYPATAGAMNPAVVDAAGIPAIVGRADCAREPACDNSFGAAHVKVDLVR